MTLLSIYWEEGRMELEEFSRTAMIPSDGQSTPNNFFIKPSPDQMLRAVVGLSLKRAKLESVYNVLRGRDIKSGRENPEVREEQFQKLKMGQSEVLKLDNWHSFLSALQHVGYRNEKMLTSETVVIYSSGLVHNRFERKNTDSPLPRY